MKRVRVVLLATHVPGPHASRVLRRRAAVRVGVMSFAAPGAGKPATVSRSLSEELRTLAELREASHLSEPEFAAAKQADLDSPYPDEEMERRIRQHYSLDYECLGLDMEADVAANCQT